MISTEDFADTELAPNNVSPLFPHATHTPASRHIHRGFPDVDPKARPSLVAMIDEEQRRLALYESGIRDGNAAGEERGYVRGFNAGQVHQRDRAKTDSWFWFAAGVLVGGAIIVTALQLGRHL